MKGLAAVLVELGKPLVLEEIEIPKLTYGQVLVKVLCSGICGSQIAVITCIWYLSLAALITQTLHTL